MREQPVAYETAVEDGFLTENSLYALLDKLPPEVTTRDVTCYSFETDGLEPTDFVEQIDDFNDVTLEWAEEPDFSYDGEQTVYLLATDQNRNETEAEAKLTVLFDREAPVIEGVRELTVEVGESVSYKQDVTVSDNLDEKVSLQVDNSTVDLNAEGDYEVIYSAEDRSGNRTEVATKLHVINKQPEGVSEEVVNAAADAVLAQITTPEMSQYEVAQAIFNWVHGIRYVNGSVKDNWVQGAYEGLINYAGDCYVYAMTSKCLLTRAGIANVDIEKIQTTGYNAIHYWNLIDIGEGWHHFDACKRRDGSKFFYLTEAELMAYYDTHDGTHEYDHSLYPTVP